MCSKGKYSELSVVYYITYLWIVVFCKNATHFVILQSILHHVSYIASCIIE